MPDYKQVVRNILNRFGYDIVRHQPRCEHPFDMLELVVERQLGSADDFYFVQVGANDGQRTDSLRPLILRHHLRGLLIEPLPDLFERLKQNYAREPQLVFENSAVGELDGERQLFRVRPGSPVPDWTFGCASFDPDKVTARCLGVPGLDKYVEAVVVRTRTVSGILARHGVTSVSLLVVDTEGFDYEVVRSALAAGLRPRLIVYEHVHLRPQVQFTCRRMLKEHDYRFIEVGLDTYAVRGAD